MLEPLLRKFKDKILKRKYVMTLHADEEMHNDDLSIYDVEAIILSGVIEERQKDIKINEWKYRIRGETTLGHGGEVVLKLSPTGKIVIITVYRD